MNTSSEPPKQPKAKSKPSKIGKIFNAISPRVQLSPRALVRGENGRQPGANSFREEAAVVHDVLNADTQTEAWETSCEVPTSKMDRSLSIQWFKNGRDSLGKNGTLVVLKHTFTSKIRAQLVNEEGIIVLDADANMTRDKFLKTIKGNAGADSAFYWDVVNKVHFSAGGTTITGAKGQNILEGKRRYYIQFYHSGSLGVALYHLFGKDHELLAQFYDKSSAFFLPTQEETPLPHKVNPAGSFAMQGVVKFDSESDDDDDSDDDDVGGFSQLFI